MVCCKCCQGYATLCRVFAHAWIWAAVVLSSLAVGSCSFVSRGRGDDFTIGMFRIKLPNSDECVAYRDNSDFAYGWIYDWARACGLLAPLFGVLVVALMMLDCCCKVCCSKYIQTGLIICCQINQGFTFLIYASGACLSRKGVDQSNQIMALCRMGSGSGWSIAAFCCYFVGGFFLCCSPKPDPGLCCRKDDDEDDGKKCCGKNKKGAQEEGKPAAQQNDKPKDEEDPAVISPAVTKEEENEEKDDQSEKMEQAKDTKPSQGGETPEEAKAVPNEERPEEANAGPDEEELEEAKAGADEKGPGEIGAVAEEEEAEEYEAPPPEAVVPVPNYVPVATMRSPSLEPAESGMEVEFDEEFGTSQVGATLY